MTNYTKLALKGTAIVLVISLFAGFLGYIVRLVLARNLSVEDFGLFNAVFSFLALLGVFKSLGFDKSLVKFIPELKNENRHDLIKSSFVYVCIIELVTNILIILAVYLLASYLSMHFFHSEKAVIILKILAFAFFFDSFVQVLKFGFQGFKQMGYFAGIDLIRMIIIFIIMTMGFKLNYGLLSPVIAYTVTPLVLLFVFGAILFAKVFPEFGKVNYVFDFAIFKRIFWYSVHIFDTSVVSLALYYTDILALTYFTDLRNVGLYSVALPTAKIFMYFPRAIDGMGIPIIAELWAKKKKDLLKAGVEELYKYSLVIIVPAVFIMFSFADLMLLVLYGNAYVGAAMPLRILSIGMIFAMLYSINAMVYAGIGEPKINSKMVFFASIFNLVGNIALIPILGMNGAAIATTGSYLIMMLYGLAKIRGFVDVSFPWVNWIKNIIAGIFIAGLVFFLKKILLLNVWIETGIILAIAGFSYIVMLFALKIVNFEELKVVYNRLIAK